MLKNTFFSLAAFILFVSMSAQADLPNIGTRVESLSRVETSLLIFGSHAELADSKCIEKSILNGNKRLFGMGAYIDFVEVNYSHVGAKTYFEVIPTFRNAGDLPAGVSGAKCPLK